MTFYHILEGVRAIAMTIVGPLFVLCTIFFAFAIFGYLVISLLRLIVIN
jgi:hypothetical protein